MDIELFHETIGNTLSNIWDSKNNTNKLSLTCLYSINIFSNDDLIFWRAIVNLEDIFQKRTDPKYHLSKECHNKLVCAIYCMLASYQTIYSLPSMLDLKWKNGKISTHIIFGEALANLSSITLLAEANKLLLSIKTSNSMDILKMVNQQISDFRNNSSLLKHFGNPTKQLLHDDFTSFRKILLNNTISSMLLIYNCKYKEIVDHQVSIDQLVDDLLVVSNISNNEVFTTISKSSFLKIL